jgi:bifunctional DNase/RNase
LQHRDRVVHVDCRLSDGIALAIRHSVPIIAADELEPLLAAA